MMGTYGDLMKMSNEAKQAKQTDAQESAQKAEQVSKRVSKSLSKKPVSTLGKQVQVALSGEAIEDLSYRLRKTPKTKINAEVPNAWKTKLDDMAHELGVGKYELVMFIIALFLREVETDQAA